MNNIMWSAISGLLVTIVCAVNFSGFLASELAIGPIGWAIFAFTLASGFCASFLAMLSWLTFVSVVVDAMNLHQWGIFKTLESVNDFKNVMGVSLIFAVILFGGYLYVSFNDLANAFQMSTAGMLTVIMSVVIMFFMAWIVAFLGTSAGIFMANFFRRKHI